MKKSVQLQHGLRVRVGGAPAACAPTAAFAKIDAIGSAGVVVGLTLATTKWPVAAAPAALARGRISRVLVRWALAENEAGVLRAFRSPAAAGGPSMPETDSLFARSHCPP